MSLAFLWLAIGTLLTVTQDIPYINYNLGWQVQFTIFAGPALLMVVMSGYLQLADLKELVRMLPKIRVESRSNDHREVPNDQDGS